MLITAVFGVLGYAFAKLDCDPAPLLLGFILGPLMEENFRRALVITQGDFAVFVTRPISASLLVAAVLLLITLLLPAIRRGRDLAFQE